LWTPAIFKKHRNSYVLFSNPSLLPFFKVEGDERGSVARVGVGVVMRRRSVETLPEVKLRLKREQDERTQKRIAELLVEAEPESEVQSILRQSRQLLQ
jgi:hypothetical protein